MLHQHYLMQHQQKPLIILEASRVPQDFFDSDSPIKMDHCTI